MNPQSNSTVLRTILVILATAVLILGGIGISGVAAQSAIPGDALYPVKTSIEQTRLSLARDAGDRAELKLSFAEKRLEEISQLITEGRNREIREAVIAFEAYLNSAIIELEAVAQGDPARAALLAREITAALTRYATTLSSLAASAPDSVKEDVIRALDTTQLAGSLDMPDDDDNENSVEDDADENDDDSANANDDRANDNGDDSNANSADDSSDDSADDGNTNADDGSSYDSADDDSTNSSADDSNDSLDDDSSNDSADDSNDNSVDNADDSDNSSDDDSSNSSDDDSNDSSDDDSSSSADDNSNDDSSGGDSGGSDDNADDGGDDDSGGDD